MIDLHYSHFEASVLELLKEKFILPVFIPAGCTDLHQVLDVVVNKSYKSGVTEEFMSFLNRTHARQYMDPKWDGIFRIDLRSSYMKPLIPHLVMKGIEKVSTADMRNTIARSFQVHALVEEARRIDTIEEAMAVLGDDVDDTDGIFEEEAAVGMRCCSDESFAQEDDDMNDDDDSAYEFPIENSGQRGDEKMQDGDEYGCVESVSNASPQKHIRLEIDNSKEILNSTISCDGTLVINNTGLISGTTITCTSTNVVVDNFEDIDDDILAITKLPLSKNQAPLWTRILICKRLFLFVQATHNGTCGFSAAAIGLTAMGINSTTKYVMKSLVAAAKNEQLHPNVNILLEYEYESIIDKYGSLPDTLPYSNYMKSRYYRLLALHFMVNIYVLMDNDANNYRLLDVHQINFQQPSIYILHSNKVFFDSLLPINDPQSKATLHDVMKMLLVDVSPLVPIDVNSLQSLMQEETITSNNNRKRKCKDILPHDDQDNVDDEDSVEDMCDDVILELGQQIINSSGRRGKVTDVDVDEDGWHYYDVAYNNSTSLDKRLWGNQIRAWVPKCSTRVCKTTNKTLSQAWDIVSVNSEECADGGAILSSHIVESKRQKKEKVLN